MARPELPPAMGEEADPNALAAFMDHVFYHDTPKRIRLRSTFNRARLYYIAKQWNQPVDHEDGTFSADWEQLKTNLNGIPMPVQNELFPIITREAALLGKVGSKPYVRPDSDDPRAEDAAAVGKDVLMDRHRETGWAGHDRRGALSMALYGTWFEASYWDVDYTKTTRVPVTTAVRCPQCDFCLAKPELEEQEAEPILSNRPEALDVEEIEDHNNPLVPALRKYTARTCPTCDTHMESGPVPALDPETEQPLDGGIDGPATVDSMVATPGAPRLEEWVPTPEDAQDETDAVGRPLGEDVPLGDTALELISVFDAYPEPSKQAVDAYPENWEEFGWETPRSLDWIRSRFPKNGDQVAPARSQEAFRHHPIIGGMGALAGPGPTILENCQLVRVFTQKPKLEKQDGEWKRNRGRLVIMADRVVLYDGDLLRESLNKPGEDIPLYHFDWAVWEERDREGFGVGMAELGFSQQDAINTTESQTMDARHRWLNPKLKVEDGVDISFQGGAGSSYSSDVLTYKRSSPETQEAPEILQGTTAPPAVWGEYDRHVEGLQRTLMQREVEGGAPPKDVTAFSALELLARKAAEGRTPRVERIRDMKQRRYKHQLQLMHEFYREKRYYHVRAKNDKWAVRSFMGADLMGQCTVLLEDEPVLDAGVAKREGISLGLQIGTVAADTAAAKRRINAHLQIPLDVNEDANNQVDAAEAEAIKWKDEDHEPVIDEDGDDQTIHWEVHKLDLGRQEWRELKEACRWSQVLLHVWGWKDELTKIEQQEAAFKLQPPVAPVPEMAQIGGQAALDGATQVYQAQMAAMQQIQALPRPVELRIMHMWSQRLRAAGFLPTEDERLAFAKVFRMEAHAAGHRWLAQKQAMAAMAGIPQPSAPGGAQGPTGMIPTPGQPVTPPPGAGAEALPGPGAPPA